MSTIIMAACWPLRGMSAAQKAVLISLADQASDDGVCWPSVGTIAMRTCLSERAVQGALAWLQKAGVVYREYRPNTSTSYTIRPATFKAEKTASRPRDENARGADAALGADGAPPADAAPGAAPAPGGADGAPGGANAAPPGVQEVHPNRKGNRHRTANEPSPAAAPPAPKVGAEGLSDEETELQAACRATWAAYSGAYVTRYGAKPVRNAQVNAKVKQFVQRLGYDEAPAVAAFYVEKVNDAFVTRECHPVGTLLQKAEGYRTQWAAGRATTNTAARQLDQSQANQDAAQDAMAILRQRRAQAEGGANA